MAEHDIFTDIENALRRERSACRRAIADAARDLIAKAADASEVTAITRMRDAALGALYERDSQE